MASEDIITSISRIEPTTGDITNYFTGGEPPKPESPEVDRISFDLYRLMDGVRDSTSSLVVRPVSGFIQATEKNLFDEQPPLGLKIHLTIPWDNPKYLTAIQRVASLCVAPNIEGKSSTFKVMYPQSQQRFLAEQNRQGEKTVTITPNYLDGEKTNVAETIRLVGQLRTIMTDIGYEENGRDNMLTGAEHKAGEGIYIRPGAFIKEGEQYMTAERGANFEEQLTGNLECPQTDGNLFQQQVREAIADGKL